MKLRASLTGNIRRDSFRHRSSAAPNMLLQSDVFIRRLMPWVWSLLLCISSTGTLQYAGMKYGSTKLQLWIHLQSNSYSLKFSRKNTFRYPKNNHHIEIHLQNSMALLVQLPTLPDLGGDLHHLFNQLLGISLLRISCRWIYHSFAARASFWLQYLPLYTIIINYFYLVFIHWNILGLFVMNME